MTLSPDTIKYLSAIIVGLLSFLTVFVKLYYDYRKSRQPNTFPNLFKVIEEIYGELDVSIRRTACVRALLLKTENGGGIPKIGSKIYSSVVFERVSDEVAATKKLWQSQELDSVYVKNLVKMVTSEQSTVDLEIDEWEGSTVYDVYRSGGVECSRIYEVARSKKAYYYLSFNFPVKTDKLTSMDRAVTHSAASNIRKVFHDSKVDF